MVFGSLAQRSETSRASIRQFVSQVHGHRLYDVNLRRSTRSGLAGYSAEILRQSLQLATLVKMNDAEMEEIALLLEWPAETYPSESDEAQLFRRMTRLCSEFSLDAVAVTRGSKGALLASSGELLRLPDSTLDQHLVHPVGAGDSFAAGLLFGILQGWTAQVSLTLANLLSSWVVQHASATPSLPDPVLAQIRLLAEQANRATNLRAS